MSNQIPEEIVEQFKAAGFDISWLPTIICYQALCLTCRCALHVGEDDGYGLENLLRVIEGGHGCQEE